MLLLHWRSQAIWVVTPASREYLRAADQGTGDLALGKNFTGLCELMLKSCQGAIYIQVLNCYCEIVIVTRAMPWLSKQLWNLLWTVYTRYVLAYDATTESVGYNIYFQSFSETHYICSSLCSTQQYPLLIFSIDKKCKFCINLILRCHLVYR